MTPDKRLIGACVAAIVLAIPTVSFMSGLVVFPVLIYGLFAILAALGLPIVLFAYATGAAWADRAMREWHIFAIIWAWCAFGLSRWGDVASGMGAKNTPYLTMLFAPYRYLLGMPIQ